MVYVCVEEEEVLKGLARHTTLGSNSSGPAGEDQRAFVVGGQSEKRGDRKGSKGKREMKRIEESKEGGREGERQREAHKASAGRG